MNFLNTETKYEDLSDDQKDLFEQLIQKTSENNNHEMKVSFDELNLPASIDLNQPDSIGKFADMTSKLISLTAVIDRHGQKETLTCFTQIDINVKKRELDVTTDTQFKRFIHKLKKDDELSIENLKKYMI